MLLVSCLFLCGSGAFCAEADPYRVEFKGIRDKELLEQVQGLSKTLELSSEGAVPLSILRKRAMDDMDLFVRLLKSEGYFDAQISEKIETGESRWKVIFDFTLNKPFILSSVEITFSPGEYDGLTATIASEARAGLQKPYKAKAVLEREEKLLFQIKKQGFPFPRIKEREIIADHETGSVKVKYIINPGKRAFWGKPVFKGLENVEQALLENLIPWGQGDLYDPDLLDTYYSDLMGLGLFSMIKINEGNISDDNRLWPEIEVSERKHKSIEIGLNYYTDEGPGTKLLWENRNLMGRGENIGFIFNLSRYLTSSTVTFKKPFFLAQKQALRLSVQKKQEDPDAYTSDSYLSSLFLDREFAGDLKISAGLVFKYSNITQINVEDKFRLLYMPLIFGLDKSNDLLDPEQGGRLAVTLIPFYSPSGDSLFYGKGLIKYSHYIKISNAPVCVLAGGITLGMIRGAERDEIPADERFYAGGGGSVRGYPYQSVGPVSGKTPLGGKSIAEVSLETRIRVTQKMGLVVFVDGGTAYSEKLFGSGEDIRLGTGAGFRYFTPIGPLRFDAGIPLNRRNSIDDRFQIYISIGQAF